METVQKIMHGHFKVMQGQKIQTKQNKTKKKLSDWMAAGQNCELGEPFPFNHAHLATWNQGSGELHGAEVGIILSPNHRHLDSSFLSVFHPDFILG